MKLPREKHCVLALIVGPELDASCLVVFVALHWLWRASSPDSFSNSGFNSCQRIGVHGKSKSKKEALV